MNKFFMDLRKIHSLQIPVQGKMEEYVAENNSVILRLLPLFSNWVILSTLLKLTEPYFPLI
jgi:hypothetical protein